MNKQLLFSLSKDSGDFIVQPFKGSGNGGQKRNKTMSACRIVHPASGAVSECQEERSFEQNKKRAFLRLLEKPEFKCWYKLKVASAIDGYHSIEQMVDAEMQKVKVEIFNNGRWQNI